MGEDTSFDAYYHSIQKMSLFQHTCIHTLLFFSSYTSFARLPYTHDDGANVPTDSWTVVFSKYCSSFVVQGHNITYLCTCMHARLMVEPNTILSLNTGVFFRDVKRDQWLPLNVLHYTVQYTLNLI